jgi:hypothetical protein
MSQLRAASGQKRVLQALQYLRNQAIRGGKKNV